MSSRPISSSGCKESGDAASCSSPPAKRLRLSGDAGADDDLDEGGKALRQSVAAILPPDIWARALSHLAFEDVNLSSFDLALPPEVELLTSLKTIRFDACGINASLGAWIPMQL